MSVPAALGAALLLLLLPPTSAARTGSGDQILAAERSVAVRPVDGGVVQAFRAPASEYGAGHRGVDLRARPGTPVRAALGGTVTFSGVVAGTVWVTVNHGGGLSTTYGSLSPRLV